MSVKNSLKVLISRFSLVFSIFVFICIVCLLTGSLSIAFLPSIIKLLKEAGLAEVINRLNPENISYQVLYNAVVDGAEIVRGLFASSIRFKVNTTLYVALVLVFAYRLFLGYYELPTISVLEAKMSSNLRIGFTNRFISNFKLSTKFIFAKMLYTIVADAVIALIMMGVFALWGVSSLLNFFLPSLSIMVFVLLQALRYSVIALWSPCVYETKGNIFSAFRYSFRFLRKSFVRVYGSFLISWILIFSVNTLVGIITLGVGLFFTVPMSMAYISTLNLVLYFRTKNRKFYLDDETVSVSN